MERATLVRSGRRLEYLTIGWNAAEGVVAIAAGAVTESISLTVFGIDSFIELASGAAPLWRMTVGDDTERRESVMRNTYCELLAYAYWRSRHTSSTNRAGACF